MNSNLLKRVQISEGINRKVAFTIAEVLITLMIIGVLAAITIPALIGNFEKQTYITEFKSFYSDMDQIIKQAELDYGCTDLKCTGIFDQPTGTAQDKAEASFNLLLPYFNLQKYCGRSSADCSYPSKYQYLNSSVLNDSSNDTTRTVGGVTRKGAGFILFHSGNCSGSLCGEIYVDVNGPNKKPNKMGRDMFDLLITNNGLMPNGRLGSWCQWNKTTAWANCKTGVGFGCAARIIEEGWQMNY